MNNKLLRSVAIYALILMLFLYLLQAFTPKEYLEMDYNQFLGYIQTNSIKECVITDRKSVEGTLKDGTKFVTIVPEDPELYNMLVNSGATVKFQLPPEPSWLMTLAVNLLPVVILAGLFFYMIQQSQGGGKQVMQFGRSKARLQVDSRNKISFKDVAGCEEAKEELHEIVDFLKHPKKYVEMGARIPKGVLIFGPPGTGKTYIARAVAGEANVPFLTISGSDFVEMFVGVGAARVRDLFEQAKKRAPAIVFIDEIDAVGRMRGAGMGGGHDEREQTLNQLLVEMDGFSTNQSIIVMAATNRPDILDPALLRPGRFDRQIVLDKPDLNARVEILKVHSRGKPIAKEVDLKVLAKGTPGFTPADLENVINEAALLTARKRKRRIGMEELEEAVYRIMTGPKKKSRIISEKEKKIVAFHEAAHALVAKKLPNADPVHEVTIIPRGVSLGHTLQLPIEDRYLITKQEILDKVTCALAGRAGEELKFNEVSTGAANDLEVATRLVRRMIMEFGMSDLGPLTFGQKEGQVFLGRDLVRQRDFSEEVAAAIDQEERKIMNRCYDKAKSILIENMSSLEQIADTLIEQETIKADELDALLAGKPLVSKDKGSTVEEGNKEESHEIEEQKAGAGTVVPVPESNS